MTFDLADGDYSSPLHIKTPLVYSKSLSDQSGQHIWLKLETEQPSGSFKSRGVGRSCWAAVQKHGPKSHLIAASGGNAGLAAAMASSRLGVKCTIFVHDKTEKAIIDKLESFGANVKRMDGGWDKVNAGALKLAEEDPNGIYIHPFEGNDLVLGHSSIIQEIYDQLQLAENNEVGEISMRRPDIISSAVGGGGLIRGLMYGCSEISRQTGTPPTHILGVTTLGADSWSLSLENEDTFIEIPDPYSMAKSLACKACSKDSVRDSRIYAKTGKLSFNPEPKPVNGSSIKSEHLTSVRIDDSYAGSAAWKLTEQLDGGKTLIELSTGAAMIPVYQPAILDEIKSKSKILKDEEKLNVVIIVCGGYRVSQQDLNHYKEKFCEGYGKIYVDGIELKTN
ncbi:uncharacterized protein L201_005201 [Kwoniella dendrophila CBS 6074]|uniref:L-serine ammonia-lyase n=1 Tax=Kwoniella dendrophila CBS 6074 TaxID=1295534 RepID=A0AAX4K0I7_9TREE